ncbi:hypothetical protein EOL15_29265 [Citrobacter freundii]|nr:hypothetical protein EOL15_29265 [Citrobacter freundii]
MKASKHRHDLGLISKINKQIAKLITETSRQNPKLELYPIVVASSPIGAVANIGPVMLKFF